MRYSHPHWICLFFSRLGSHRVNLPVYSTNRPAKCFKNIWATRTSRAIESSPVSITPIVGFWQDRKTAASTSGIWLMRVGSVGSITISKMCPFIRSVFIQIKVGSAQLRKTLSTCGDFKIGMCQVLLKRLIFGTRLLKTLSTCGDFKMEMCQVLLKMLILGTRLLKTAYLWGL